MKRFKLLFALIAFVCSFALLCACGGETGGGLTEQEQTEQIEQQQTEQTEEAEQEQTEHMEQTEQTEEQEQTEVSYMYVTIGGNKLKVELEDNSSVAALIEILRLGDITYTADDYGGFEKVGDIGYTLPQNNQSVTTQAGDVILYVGRNICLYYGVNTWSFTKIGHIGGYSQDELYQLLCAGGGEVLVTLSLN